MIPKIFIGLFIYFLYIPTLLSDDFVEINYIPFKMHFYFGVSRDTIRASTLCVMAIPENSEHIDHIYNIIENGESGHFHDGIVRVEIVKPNGRSIFIDQQGSVFESGTEVSKKLDAIKFSKLVKIIEGLFDTEACNEAISNLMKGKGWKPYYEEYKLEE